MSDERPLSALPSPRARVLAFAAILVAGLCGAMIGWSFVDLQCSGSCAGPSGIGAVVGGVAAGAGVAVVAVLTLRAMGEWRRISEAELRGEEPNGSSSSSGGGGGGSGSSSGGGGSGGGGG